MFKRFDFSISFIFVVSPRKAVRVDSDIVHLLSTDAARLLGPRLYVDVSTRVLAVLGGGLEYRAVARECIASLKVLSLRIVLFIFLCHAAATFWTDTTGAVSHKPVVGLDG